MATVSVVRGCGVRQPGGTYLVTDVGARGIPLEALVVDPPRPLAPPLATTVAPQGMTLTHPPAGAPAGSAAHLIDWVGVRDYPNVADFVEELALFGSSRRVPSTFNFAALGPRSKHVLIHPRAIVTNPEWPLRHRVAWEPVRTSNYFTRALHRTQTEECPFHPPHELGATEMCASLWWELLLPGAVRFSDEGEVFELQCQRQEMVRRLMPSFGYDGYTLPDADEWVPEWQLGAFLQLPITRIEVVNDPEDMRHEPALDRARKASLPVEVVDE